MAEQDKKSTTINFAGREIDRKAFIDLAVEKAEQWMNYQQLLGDERTDFLDNFNEIILGIVDNKYTTSEFGRLLHSDTRDVVELPEGYYRKRDGERKDSEGKWYNSPRRNFNPIGNVETYLNGIAKLVPEYKEKTETPEPVKKKRWRRGMVGQLIGDKVFGAGNEQDPTKNPEQVNAWADALDPYKDGKRSTDKRRIFINGILKDYLKDLDNYEMSDTQREEERKNIEALLDPNTAQWQLNTISPLLSHLMFTGERYMTDEQKAALAALAAKNAYESGDPNATLETAGYTTPEAALAGYTRRIQNIENNWKSEFDLFNIIPKYTDSFTTKAKYNIPLNIKNSILNKNIQELEKYLNKLEYLEDRDDVMREYFNKFGDLVGDKYYIINWNIGCLYEITRNVDSNKNVTINRRSIKSVIDNKNKELDLYNYLYNEYKKLKGYKLPEYKKGGILKFEDPPGAIPAPQVPEEPTKPKTTKSNIYYNIFPWWQHDPFTVDPSIFDPNRYKSTNKNQNAVRGNYELHPEQNKHWGKSFPDTLTDSIGIAKMIYGDVYNNLARRELLGLLAVHIDPFRKEALIHSPKLLYDNVANNKAKYNQMGAVHAGSTSDTQVNLASQLATQKTGDEINSDIINQAGAMTLTQRDKVLDNENENFQNRFKAAEANHQADIARINNKKQVNAEYYSRLGKQRMLQLSEMQQGIAQSGKENYENELNWAIQEDNDVKTISNNIDSLSLQILTKQKELKTAVTEDDKIAINNDILILQQERNMELYKLNRAQKQAALNYLRTHRVPRGYPWALPSALYDETTPRPYKDGGKVEYIEQQKTKRMYAKMLFDMMKMDMNHAYKISRDAYKDYRKIFMQLNK